MYKTRLLMGLLALSFLFGMFAVVAEAAPRTSAPPADWLVFYRTATEEQMRYELRHGLYPTNALFIAAGDNPNPGVTRALIEAGANIEARSHCFRAMTPLGLALLRNNNIGVVRAIVEARANINAHTGGGATATAVSIAES